ncbi:MAG: GNAT family N-acetyltransferase [Actinomycetes bacterium]
MVVLRPTIEADLDSVVALEASPDTSRWLAETGRSWHTRALSDPDQEHLVVTVEDVVAGFVVLAGVCDPGGVVELRRMVVGAEHRGIGLGRELLHRAVAHAHETLGARGIWLDVKPTNHRAISLYHSEGFGQERMIPGAPAAPDGTPPDLIVMTRFDRQ